MPRNKTRSTSGPVGVELALGDVTTHTPRHGLAIPHRRHLRGPAVGTFAPFNLLGRACRLGVFGLQVLDLLTGVIALGGKPAEDVLELCGGGVEAGDLLPVAEPLPGAVALEVAGPR
ncbi:MULTISPECIES: hypothetical protein [unclassified Corynebacterium]|uniref:hypothetical protein n=1 Tax=unclassified Corynebacterium TaxID=2624378 RepID=UPI00143AE8DE|nr:MULTISPECIES: hypothetical protein [unclassified Corynebacterium]